MTRPSETDERLIEIETKISFQERTIETLNSVVTEQQGLIDRLATRVERIAARIELVSESLDERGGAGSEEAR